MRITKVNIPATEIPICGLEDIAMDKLGKVVLLAGKNGAGKSRLLNKIFSKLPQKPGKSAVINARNRLDNYKDGINGIESRISELEKQISIGFTPAVLKQNIENKIKSDADLNEKIKDAESILEWKFIETDELVESYIAVNFVPRHLMLTDPVTLMKSQIGSYANSLSVTSMDNIHNGALPKIQAVQDRWFNATHPGSDIGDAEKSQAISDYNKLCEVIKNFLNTTISRTIEGDATLFGFPLGQAQLSNGQKILIQFCLAIYSQEIALKDLIIFLDEPENHLHPSAIIETIELISKNVSNGQIWIATHSVPLLAHFDPSCIWYVENNKVSYAGKIPEKVLHSLLGDENEIARLQDFISLPSQFATSQYAFESLFEPIAVVTKADDPQSLQIRENLLRISKNGKLKILDYGAGKGRVLANLLELDIKNQEKIIESLDYIAFDKYANDKEICQGIIDNVYSGKERRYFNDINELLSVEDKGSFDIVLMCNVLHEIDPKDWLKLFAKDGEVSSLLNENGILLLVEDQQIPIGEKAYQKGFLVLDTAQLKDLFKITKDDGDFVFNDKRGDGRLKAHHIPKRLLERIDKDSREAAIKSLSNLAKQRIIEIRSQQLTYKNGKLHGFWTQQFANAQLNLAELTIT